MKEKKGIRLALKLSLTVAIPILLITVIGIVLGAVKQNDLSDNLVEREVSGIARSIRQTYSELGDGGEFAMNGDTLTKGTKTLSGDYDLIDRIKEEQDVELSLFYGDTRILTTLTDETGKREINTKISAEIYEKLQKGEDYFSTDIKLFGKPYSGYYVPLYQPGTKDVIGSIFCGRSRDQVIKGMRSTVLSMSLAMLRVWMALSVILGMSPGVC